MLRARIRGGYICGLLAIAIVGGPMVFNVQGDVIHACVSKANGGIRILAPGGTCKSSETPLDWNIQGPKGDQGNQGVAGLPGPAFPISCPSDSVLVGTTCIDKHEASVWETPNPALIAKIKAGTITLADFTAAGTDLGAGGAIQHGVLGDDYGSGCSDTGNGCVNFYAVSIPGATPSAFLTWFQAAAAARNAGKRLPTNAEWQAAALGTPDPGESAAGSQDCNTKNGGGSGVDAVVPTGSRSNCVSDAGAFDMVGNVWEWVGDWGDLSNACTKWWSDYGEDVSCIGDGSTSSGTITGAMIRGGAWNDGTNAGVFSVQRNIEPSSPIYLLGFRCAR